RIEKSLARFLVSELARGETGSVNAVINVFVKDIVQLLVLGFDLFWEKIDIFVFRELVEYIVEHGTDVVLAIVHDLFRLLIPKHGDGDALLEIRISGRVGFA